MHGMVPCKMGGSLKLARRNQDTLSLATVFKVGQVVHPDYIATSVSCDHNARMQTLVKK